MLRRSAVTASEYRTTPGGHRCTLSAIRTRTQRGVGAWGRSAGGSQVVNFPSNSTEGATGRYVTRPGNVVVIDWATLAQAISPALRCAVATTGSVAAKFFPVRGNSTKNTPSTPFP